MTIADFLIKNVRNGNLSTSQRTTIKGMGETWTFVPNRTWQPGVLKNVLTGSIMSVSELYDREVDNSWFF
jgi:hypothetical protein